MIERFGGDASNAEHLEGGRGDSWRAGAVVLKPADPHSTAGWLGPILSSVPDGPGFRLGRPVPSKHGAWIVDGWEASVWMAGEPRSDCSTELWAAADALHAVLLGAVEHRPARLDHRSDPWAVGDRVAWGEAAIPDESSATVDFIADVMSRIEGSWRWQRPQLIHGDLGHGNVLFADDLGLAPAIIDFSPYWRPAGFATAITTVDAIAWDVAPVSLVAAFLGRERMGADLLARAIVYRVVAASRLWPKDDRRVRAELSAYGRVLEHLWS